MNQQDIEQVVKAVLLKMQSSDTPSAAVHEMGVFASLDDAVAAAKVAQQGLKSVAMRQLAIAAIREAGEKHARDLAELAVSETGMGRVEDKFAKNVAQARGTPGVECLSPQVLTGDNGLTLIENAPWGVVASVTPSTNPAATVINNAISLIAAGNSVIFAPHPAAKKVSQRAITLLNQAIVAAGGPENLLVTVANPDIETAQRLFKFPGIGLLVVTGGEAVVEAARKHTNKRLIAAGAGNPPVVVDETADLARAAQSIVKGASFDNNIICADEKVLIVVDSVADELMRLMEGQHAVKLTAEQAQQLQPVLLKNIDERGKGTVSRDWVGRDAAKIAAAIGLNVPQETRLLFVETTAEHPFAVTELSRCVSHCLRSNRWRTTNNGSPHVCKRRQRCVTRRPPRRNLRCGWGWIWAPAMWCRWLSTATVSRWRYASTGPMWSATASSGISSALSPLFVAISTRSSSNSVAVLAMRRLHFLQVRTRVFPSTCWSLPGWK